MEKEEKETIVPTRRLTRSMVKKKRSPSPQPMDVSTEPINLSTPSPSPIKEPPNISPKKLAETLRFANYTTEEVDQFIADNTKEKDKASSPPPSTFDSQTINSGPAAETSTIGNDDLIKKLKEDLKVVEVLERHIKEENSTLKGRIHTVQDKYDSLKKKYKMLKRQLKEKTNKCVELQQQLDSVKATPSSSPTKLQVLAATVVSAAGL